MNKKLILTLALVIILAIGIPVAVYLSQHSQDIQQHASVDASLVATVDNAPVTEQDVKTEAREQYNDKGITKETLQNSLDTVVKDRLLESEAKKQGVTVSTTEVTDRATQLGGDAAGQVSIKSQARSELLQEKLSKVLTKTREVSSVGFWLPPDNYDAPLTAAEKQTITSQKAQKTAVLNDIEQKLSNNEEPLVVAQEIQKKYPKFISIIAVNGYTLEKTPVDEPVLTQPKFYSYQKAYKSNPFLSEVFTMTSGQVKTILTDSNAGGVVVKITDSSDGTYTSFEDWLAKSKSARTKIIKQP